MTQGRPNRRAVRGCPVHKVECWLETTPGGRDRIVCPHGHLLGDEEFVVGAYMTPMEYADHLAKLAKRIRVAARRHLVEGLMVCRACRKAQAVTEFYRSASGAPQQPCRTCHRERCRQYQRKRYAEDPAYRAAEVQRKRDDYADPAIRRHLLDRQKRNRVARRQRAEAAA